MNFNTFNKIDAKSPLFGALKAKATVGVCAATVFFAQTAPIWASESAEAELEPLAWKTDLALWTAVVFVLTLVVLGKFAFGPIVKALDQRENDQFERLAAAEKANADARELLEQYRTKLADSEEEVRRMLAEAKADADGRAKKIVDEARRTAEADRDRALQEVEAATDRALREIAVKSADLATSLAGKILKESIDPAKGARLLDEAVGEIVKK